MIRGFTESVVEQATLDWLDTLGYAVLHGTNIAAGEPGAERSHPNYRDVVLDERLRQALLRLKRFALFLSEKHDIFRTK